MGIGKGVDGHLLGVAGQDTAEITGRGIGIGGRHPVGIGQSGPLPG